MSDINMSKIKKLLNEKKYSEIIIEIKKFSTEKNRSSVLHNLLGVCHASRKGRTEDDVKGALINFEKAFYKDNLGEISLESLCNHIKLCSYTKVSWFFIRCAKVKCIFNQGKGFISYCW